MARRKRKPEEKPAEEPTVDTADAKPLDGEEKPAEATPEGEPSPDETGLLPDPAPEPDAEPESTPEAIDEPEEPAEPEPLPPPPPMPRPVIDDVLAEGYSKSSAQKIVDALAAAAKVVEDETEKRDALHRHGHRAHYLVSCPRKRGYWAIGRKFTTEEIVFVDELTDDQRREMDLTNPLHLTVQRIGFDDEV